MPVWRGDDGPDDELPAWVRETLGDDPPPPEPLRLVPPPPADPPRRIRWWLIAVVVALLAIVGAVPLIRTVRSGERAMPATPASPPPWAVDSCVRQSGGPTSYPSDLNHDARRVWDMQRTYDTVACTDPAAQGRITTKGVEYGRMDRVADSGCPADTDFELRVTDRYNLRYQVWCVRSLKPPHPGDPGGGAGHLVTGDCVMVRSSAANRRNDLISELPCTERFFAKVLAQVAAPAACPAEALSRIPLPRSPATILCLGPGDGGMIVAPGECIDWPSNMFDIVRRVPCTGRLVYTVIALVDTERACPRPSGPFTINGYDRFVCLRSPTG